MFKLRIVTPEKTLFDGDTTYLALNTDDGEQVILEGHAPSISKVEIGELRYKDNSETHVYAVSSGFLEVKENEVQVAVDNALHSKEIDIERAEEAKRRAEELISQMNTSADILKLKAQIKLANLHISTAKKYRKTDYRPEAPIDS